MFIVYGLPRSRTFWLSKFLSHGGWHCGHDEIRHCRTMEDVKAWLSQPLTGTVETAVAPFWRLAQKIVPEARLVVLRRPVDEVVASLVRTGCFNDTPELRALMARLDGKLAQIERRTGALSVSYKDLFDEDVCARVFEHCTGLPHDSAWWRRISPVNLQVDMSAIVRYAQAYQPQLEKLRARARYIMLADRARGDGFVPDSLVIKQETFETFWPDAQAGLTAQSIAVIEAPDYYKGLNWPMMFELEKAGNFMITTARCNGRIVGYVGSYLGFSLEAPGETSAVQTFFYRDDSFPGLGTRLQRASIAALRERGIDEVFIRDGVRPNAEAIAHIAKKLGGEPFGQLYKIDLRDS